MMHVTASHHRRCIVLYPDSSQCITTDLVVLIYTLNTYSNVYVTAEWLAGWYSIPTVGYNLMCSGKNIIYITHLLEAPSGQIFIKVEMGFIGSGIIFFLLR